MHTVFSACNSLKSSGTGISPPSPQPLQTEGVAAFVTMPGKEKRAFVKRLEKASEPKSPSPGSCQCSCTGAPREQPVSSSQG